ncbi:MAG TPA: hypothetical protein VNZ05_07185 [Solirubrobacteraceae bacterium]|nr:hypothetical protein [Solirubrobacteraceae bacterium]
MKGSRNDDARSLGASDAVLLGLSALAPACLAAWHVGNVPDAAHDGAVARVLAFAPQPWRALDVIVGALPAALPIGTRAARAALGSSLVAACTGAVLYILARRLLGACADTRRLRFLLASIAAVTPLVAAPWQIESAAVGGSVTGALLVLAPIALACEGAPWAVVALALGLALGYEPMVGACAGAGCAALLASSHAARESLAIASRDRRPLVPVALLVGLTPWLLAVLRVRGAGLPLGPALAEAWSGERGLSHGGSPLAFAGAEMGFMLVALAAGGAVLAMLVPGARPLTSAAVALVASGLASAWLGAPLGPTRYGAPVLAAFAAACVLAGVAMQALVRSIAAARVPMARASAAMVIVLELAIPADLMDDALVRAAPRASGAAAAWDDAAWASLPPRSIVLVTAPPVYARALAAQARGALRDDVTLVPTFLHDPRVWHGLAGDPALLPLYRDLELLGMPSEAALSSLASVRPVAVSYEPRWGRPLAKHLVPATLFDRFQPEPRGASDRRAGLDAFAPVRDRLQRAVGADPELRAAAAILLRARARLAVDLSSDADLIARASADLHVFAPAD